MRNDWWTGLAEGTQRYADMGDMRAFYEALKAVCGPSHQIQAPLRSSGGCTLLTDQDAILQRWSEHFEGLVSDRHTVQKLSLAKIPQVDVELELDDPPTREEIRKATMQLKVGKSPGIDGIPAEVYQHGGATVLNKLHDLVTNCLDKRDSTAGPQGCSHRLSIQKQWRKIRPFKLARHHCALHCRQNLGSRLAE